MSSWKVERVIRFLLFLPWRCYLTEYQITGTTTRLDSNIYCGHVWARSLEDAQRRVGWREKVVGEKVDEIPA